MGVLIDSSLTLITGNRGEFDRVSGLTVEVWS